MAKLKKKKEAHKKWKYSQVTQKGDLVKLCRDGVRTCRSGDLSSLEIWADGNVVHPEHGCRLGNEWIESSPVQNDLGALVDGKLSMNWQCVLAVQ